MENKSKQFDSPLQSVSTNRALSSAENASKEIRPGNVDEFVKAKLIKLVREEKLSVHKAATLCGIDLRTAKATISICIREGRVRRLTRAQRKAKKWASVFQLCSRGICPRGMPLLNAVTQVIGRFRKDSFLNMERSAKISQLAQNAQLSPESRAFYLSLIHI
eukprot:TRINITY_DN2156_c0_g1_i7.p1 TRINITY_DN2156_c0_g1~~TRINITY_DN2156_c0_g1_i7.p1  ORF type:complete len:162 (+),score=3.22 TRINITY_DN2156_c0_g1_i7:164-649(+)